MTHLLAAEVLENNHFKHIARSFMWFYIFDLNRKDLQISIIHRCILISHQKR